MVGVSSAWCQVPFSASDDWSEQPFSGSLVAQKETAGIRRRRERRVELRLRQESQEHALI